MPAQTPGTRRVGTAHMRGESTRRGAMGSRTFRRTRISEGVLRRSPALLAQVQISAPAVTESGAPADASYAK